MSHLNCAANQIVAVLLRQVLQILYGEAGLPMSVKTIHKWLRLPRCQVVATLSSREAETKKVYGRNAEFTGRQNGK